MVGGTVLEVCNHPSEQHLVYVNVGQRPYSRIEQCAVYLGKTKHTDKIEIGDKLWWHGRWAMWTPQANHVDCEEAERRGLKCGIDYDIKIPRIGFSGVSHPYQEHRREANNDDEKRKG